jgi:hypothetical protein
MATANNNNVFRERQLLTNKTILKIVLVSLFELPKDPFSRSPNKRVMLQRPVFSAPLLASAAAAKVLLLPAPSLFREEMQTRAFCQQRRRQVNCSFT